jgi:hypothetical protein
LVADVLTRFRMLTMLATITAEGERENSTPEAIAVSSISMKMEFDSLVRNSADLGYLSSDKILQHTSIKELLALSRRLKELWVFGPLGKEDPNGKAQAEQVRGDVARVAELLNQLETKNMTALAEEAGGSWKPLERQENKGETDAPNPVPAATQ